MTTLTMPRTKNIYFARHGERIDWIDQTWRDTAERRLDSPLSPYGVQQAHELGVYVARLQPRITHIYASPFLRTIQTALQVANQLNKNVSSTSEITKIRVEPGFGEYFLSDVIWNENNIYRPLHQLSEISQNIEYFDQDYDSVIKADYYLQTGVETRRRLRDRLRRVLQCTLDAHTAECNILIVTHAATLIEGVRALVTVSREKSQKVIKKEEVEITINQEKNDLSVWDMSPVRAGVCSLTHLQLMDDRWNLSKNGLTSYLSKGEQNAWIFPEDASLYETTE
jgi:broad specificity phosphatase PhoE